MDLMEQKGKRNNPIKDVLNKFKYSFDGMIHCFKNETSFTFEFLTIIGVIILGNICHIEFMEWVFSLISLFMIMEIEFLNTGIEAVVDLVTKEYAPLAKVAKDCGSAATCMATFIALVVNLIIFVPHIWPLIFG